MALYIGTPAGSGRHCHAERVALNNGLSGSQEPEYSAVSTNVQEKDRNAAQEAGMDGFTEKPIFVDKLFGVMQQYLKEDSK